LRLRVSETLAALLLSLVEVSHNWARIARRSNGKPGRLGLSAFEAHWHIRTFGKGVRSCAWLVFPGLTGQLRVRDLKSVPGSYSRLHATFNDFHFPELVVAKQSFPPPGRLANS
jgi:hypothetical protein